MSSLNQRRLNIIVQSSSQNAPKLSLSPRERAFKEVLTPERLAMAAPALWKDLLERCYGRHRPPTVRREWLEFRQRAIVKRVARSGASLTPSGLARGLRAVTAAHFLRDDLLDGIEALCSLSGRAKPPAKRR